MDTAARAGTSGCRAGRVQSSGRWAGHGEGTAFSRAHQQACVCRGQQRLDANWVSARDGAAGAAVGKGDEQRAKVERRDSVLRCLGFWAFPSGSVVRDHLPV